MFISLKSGIILDTDDKGWANRLAEKCIEEYTSYSSEIVNIFNQIEDDLLVEFVMFLILYIKCRNNAEFIKENY